jgi:hypothetical protein
MNSKALSKLEKGYIQLDWKDYINRVELTKDHMETIIDMIDVFKHNKTANELVVFRFQGIPAYITIKREEYRDILDWMHQKMLHNEFFENCKRINDLLKSI